MFWFILVIVLIAFYVTVKGKEAMIKSLYTVINVLEKDRKTMQIELDFYKADNAKLHKEELSRGC
jgi:hypothetical protein